MRKKKTFEYTSYFAAEFNGFLQYRISGGSNGLEERRVLKSLDDYLIQSGMVKKKLDGIIVDAWINSLNVGGNTKAHYVSVYRQFAHYLTGLGYKAYIPPPLQIKRNYTPYVFTSEEMKRLFEACDNIPARRSLTKAEVWLPVMVRMLYGCGLRVGEAVSLQNKDIDWTEGTLLIRAAKGNKDRLVPMSNSLIDVCRTSGRSSGFEVQTMTFYEQELRKIVGERYPDATYVGRACYVRLSDMNRAKIQFVTGIVSNQYNALQMTILNRSEGQVDTLRLRFSDLLGTKVTSNPNFRNGVDPHIWDD